MVRTAHERGVLIMINDDLTKGQISHHFRTLAVPAAFGMLFATLYNVVDVFFAGMLGTYAQAGLAIGYQAFFIMMAVGFGLGSALSALCIPFSGFYRLVHWTLANTSGVRRGKLS